MNYGFLKDKNGNKIYINDNSIYHEGKKLNDVINAKADSSNVYNKAEIDTKINSKANTTDVYAKTQLDSTLLPMIRIVGSTLSDSSTISLSIQKNRPYIFINSHINNREIILITMRNDNVTVDRIINTGSTDLTSFTLKDDKLTIKGAKNCRGILYMLNYQVVT